MISPFKHTDWLKEFQIGLGIAIGVGIGLNLFHLGALVVDMSGTDTGLSTVTTLMPADYDSFTVAEAGADLADRARLVDGGAVEVELVDPTVGEYVLSLLTWLPGACVTIAVACMLYSLVRNARRSEPFTARVVTRLRVMSAVALLGGTLAGFIAIAANYLLSSGAVAGAASSGEFPWAWVIGGVAGLAIADVMARGQRMREDLDGVI